MAKKQRKAHEVNTIVGPKTSVETHEGFFKRNLYQIIVFVFTFILFANSIPNDYNLDDELVTRNHRLTSKGISGIPEIFRSTYYKDQFYAYEYRPVVLSTFAIEHSFFGDVPQVSHLINVLLYSLLCVLLFNTLRQLFPALNPMFFLIVTLLFAAHPSHTEAVDNIKCRDEILAFLFSLIALRMGLRFVRETLMWKKVLWATLIAPMFMLALLNKLTIISFAVIIPMTVILFAEADFFEVGFISLSLIIPSLMLVNLANLFQKMGFGILLLAANLALYVLINRQKVFAFFTLGINEREKDKDLIQQLIKPGTGFKILLEGIIPSKSLFSADAILLTLLLAGLYVTGLFFQLQWLFIPTGLLLVALTIFGNNKMSWWATVFFYITSIITLFQFPLGISVYGDLVSLGLVYQIFFGRRDLALPSLFLLLAYAGVNLVWQDNFNALYFFAFFLCLRHKYTWIILFPLFMFTIFSTVYDPFYLASFWTRNDGWVLVLIMMTAILLRRNMVILSSVFRVLCLAVVLLYQISYGSNTSQVTISAVKAQDIAVKTNATIIPGTQNRPLDFIEQPVKNTSPLSTRIGTSSEILFHYFYKTILPYPLSFYYGYKFIVPMEPTSPKALVGMLVFLLLAILAFWQLNKDKVISYWVFFYLISILVFSNFLIPVPGLLGDRFLLVPSLAWCFLFAWLVFKLLKVNPAAKDFSLPTIPSYSKYGIAALLLLYSGITFARNFDWKDDITLFTHDTSYVSNSAQANNLLGVHLMVRSNSEKNYAEVEKLRIKATEYFTKAVEIYPDFMNAYYDLGRSNGVLGAMAAQANRPQDADRYFNVAIDALQNTMRIDSTFSDAYMQMAMILDQKGDLDQAAKYYKLVIVKQPGNLAAYTDLSYIFFRQKRMDESLVVNKFAHEQIPLAYEPVVNVAKTYLNMDQTDSALVWMEKAYAMNSKDENLVRTLYELSKRMGDTQRTAYYGQQIGIK